MTTTLRIAALVRFLFVSHARAFAVITIVILTAHLTCLATGQNRPAPWPTDGSNVWWTSGNVGIGTKTPQSLLAVKGTITAKEVIVTNTVGADYVFKPDYRLGPLQESASYITENHHLPGIPSEAEVKENGVSLGDMQAKLLAKIEELTLHMIRAEERNNSLEWQNQELRDRVARLEQAR
jgi:hypothetical protein